MIERMIMSSLWAASVLIAAVAGVAAVHQIAAIAAAWSSAITASL